VTVWLVARTRQTRKAEDDGEGKLYGFGLGQIRWLRGTRLPGRRRMRWQPPWRDGEGGGRYGAEEMEGGRWA
jgi:hypothetical protein